MKSHREDLIPLLRRTCQENDRDWFMEGFVRWPGKIKVEKRQIIFAILFPKATRNIDRGATRRTYGVSVLGVNTDIQVGFNSQSTEIPKLLLYACGDVRRS